MKTLVKICVVITLCVLFVNVSARADGETKCRYEELNGLKGLDLRMALQEMIKDHTVLSYSKVRADNAQVDIDENGKVMDMYSDCEFGPYDYCGGETNYPECNCYNREHSLPKSFWGGSKEEPMYTDLHHVIPTDFVANTERSAWVYDEAMNQAWTNGVSTKGYGVNFTGETVFEPADKYKGDIARIYFYMLTCYMDKNFTVGGKGWKFFNYANNRTDFNSTSLNLMLKWHRNDPVSEKEKDRNDKVENVQGNRNPFVDDPNLAEYIWAKPNVEYVCSGDPVPVDDDIVGAITCEEARTRTLSMEVGAYSETTETVVGYVTEIVYAFGNGVQSYWMADKKGGGQVFEAYKCNATEAVYVGDKVALSGKLYNYNNTPEIKNGATQILERNGNREAVEDVYVPKADVRKVLIDGQLYIIVDDMMFDVRGQQVR